MDGSTAAVEIACDESGSEGERLAGGNTDVFGYGSVRIDAAAAAACVAELRARIRSPAVEYKANHLLRRKHRAVLAWFLGPAGPVAARAHVYLVDKPFLLVTRVVAEVAGGTATAAAALYRAGPAAFGADRWGAFLTASNDLLRAAGRRPAPDDPGAMFAQAVEGLSTAGPGAGAAAVAVVDELRAGRERAVRLRDELDRAPGTVASLDPLVPALARVVEHWSDGGWPVRVLHDEQRILTPERIAALGTLDGRLAGVRFADSMAEPRVQVADFLAGVARRIAEDELAGAHDPELAGLLCPYVDPRSVWADEASWAALGRAPESVGGRG
ncbi:hypothetical protein E1262_23725 [Jiangella aurantiaca]|uniref:DUF3800 domain-containing protein n=1 Tax=Jiangella aurantiaca TaxID=2530373 RepID=A0A4R5A4G3_9ACTN|nr:DUF3800 domain-containing protein [Jiangella aurantiaca]TDD65950.1 hypothetical protein E1262_23725 [Jiangella aurantiaca]